MNTKSRIASILKAHNLDSSITNLPSFHLSKLNIEGEQEFQLPTNLRLGHIAEKIVSQLIKSSTNYQLLYENMQLIEDKQTIGEIDFIIEEIKSHQIIHMEFAYKFYLFDPSISLDPINNWIGPNRNDSLQEKLDKLKNKQFPLLYHPCAKSMFPNLPIDELAQVLCFLVSLFIPYQYKADLHPSYQKAIQGYYLNFTTFVDLDHPSKNYYIPNKKEWGIDPSQNESWANYNSIEEQLKTCMLEEQAPLVWQKQNNTYLAFFVIWW